MSALATTDAASHDHEAGLAVTRGVADGVWTVRLVGDHDLTTVPMLEAATYDIVAGLSDVVIDLSGATFIDCAVVNWLVRTHRTRRRTGLSGLRIVEGAPSATVARVLGLTGGRTLLDGNRVVVPVGSPTPRRSHLRSRPSPEPSISAAESRARPSALDVMDPDWYLVDDGGFAAGRWRS